MEFTTLGEKDLIKKLSTDVSTGLSSSKVLELQGKHGLNELPAEEGESLWQKIKEQFEDILVRILLAAAVVSFVTSYLG